MYIFQICFEDCSVEEVETVAQINVPNVHETDIAHFPKDVHHTIVYPVVHHHTIAIATNGRLGADSHIFTLLKK